MKSDRIKFQRKAIFDSFPAIARINYLWWRIRYSVHAMRKLYCSPVFAWKMANADDAPWLDGETPKDAVDSELSYWDE